MKKRLAFLTLAFILAVNCFTMAGAVNQTLADKTETTSLSNNDIFYVLRDPTGAKLDRKITFANLKLQSGFPATSTDEGIARFNGTLGLLQNSGITIDDSNNITIGNTGLHLLDTNASHDLIIAPGSNITADRTLTVTTGDANRTLTLSGNFTGSGTCTGSNTGDQNIVLSGDVTGSGTTGITTSILALDATKIAGGSVDNTEFGYLDGVTSSIQTQFTGKQATITGAATTITGSDLTVDRAIISSASGKIAVSPVTSTELGYSSGVTSAIQTQINAKQASNAALTSIAGLTTSADKSIYTTASNTYTTYDLTSAGRALIDDVDATAQRTTLGLGTAATQATGTSGATIPFLNGNNVHSGTNSFTASVTMSPANANVVMSPTGTGLVTINPATTGSMNNVTIGGSTPAAGTFSSLAITSGAITNGTYTPTLTNVANVAASTANSRTSYIRVGDFVTVNGRVDIDPTSASVATQLRISLPIASNMTNNADLSGVINAYGVAGQCGAVYADPTNDTALVEIIPPSAANLDHRFTFMYRIL